uniref:uncharacterized protein LOC118544589 n=1 Tax=Halichoerus grypus TaxID=9711 RepID=UPI001658CA59|nr:uncharacterized protein LOC118544589 [Halichoerus grypus]
MRQKLRAFQVTSRRGIKIPPSRTPKGDFLKLRSLHHFHNSGNVSAGGENQSSSIMSYTHLRVPEQRFLSPVMPTPERKFIRSKASGSLDLAPGWLLCGSGGPRRLVSSSDPSPSCFWTLGGWPIKVETLSSLPSGFLSCLADGRQEEPEVWVFVLAPSLPGGYGCLQPTHGVGGVVTLWVPLTMLSACAFRQAWGWKGSLLSQHSRLHSPALQFSKSHSHLCKYSFCSIHFDLSSLSVPSVSCQDPD